MEEDPNIDALVEWMHAHPEADKFKHDKVTIAKVPFLGRGIVATADIVEGEIFMEVPFVFILTIDNPNVKNSAELLHAVKNHPIGDYKELMGAIVILLEMDNPDSFWRPYLNTFPKHVDMPDSWTEEELELVKETSTFYDLIKYTKATIDNKYHNIVKPFMEQHPELFSRIFSFEEYRHALALSSSRSFDFGDICGQHAVIPYVDFINHCSDLGGSTKKNQPAGYFYENDTDVVVEHIFKVVAHQNYKAGDQIFITYGERTNAQFLLSYGFCFPNNEADILEILNVELPKPLVPEPEDDAPPSRVKKLKEQLLPDMCFSLQIDHEDDRPYSPITLLNLIRLGYLSKKEKIDLYFAHPKQKPKTEPPKETQNGNPNKKKNRKKRKKRAQEHAPPEEPEDVIAPMNDHLPVSTHIDGLAHRYLVSFLEKRLAQYPTTIEQDDEILAKDENLTYNAKKAILFRQEEKKLLRHYIERYKEEPWWHDEWKQW